MPLTRMYVDTRIIPVVKNQGPRRRSGSQLLICYAPVSRVMESVRVAATLNESPTGVSQHTQHTISLDCGDIMLGRGFSFSVSRSRPEWLAWVAAVARVCEWGARRQLPQSSASRRVGSEMERLTVTTSLPVYLERKHQG